MAVPKRKWSHSRSSTRAANKGLKAQAFTYCEQSGLAVAPHTVCLKSGYYKGEKVLTTKFERSMKRNELRKNKMDRMQAAAAPEQVNAEVSQAQEEIAQEQAAKAKKTRKKASDQ